LGNWPSISRDERTTPSSSNTTWFWSTLTLSCPSSVPAATLASSWSARAGTFTSNAAVSGASSAVSFTLSRYESVATIRSSRSVAETRIPVSTGRVSSREADPATFSAVSTKAPTGTETPSSELGSGNGGKSSARSVRMWKVAPPEISSTSCSAARSSSETSAAGSERTTSSSSRAGRTTVPSLTVWAGSGTRRLTSMSVALSSHC